MDEMTALLEELRDAGSEAIACAETDVELRRARRCINELIREVDNALDHIRSNDIGLDGVRDAD